MMWRLLIYYLLEITRAKIIPGIKIFLVENGMIYFLFIICYIYIIVTVIV